MIWHIKFSRAVLPCQNAQHAVHTAETEARLPGIYCSRKGTSVCGCNCLQTSCDLCSGRSSWQVSKAFNGNKRRACWRLCCDVRPTRYTLCLSSMKASLRRLRRYAMVYSPRPWHNAQLWKNCLTLDHDHFIKLYIYGVVLTGETSVHSPHCNCWKHSGV